MIFSALIKGFAELDHIPYPPRDIQLSKQTFIDYCLKAFTLSDIEEASVATCISCDKPSLWIQRKMVWPELPSIPPTEHMPDDVRAAYMEAQAVISRSPRCACAMLRLALERLCVHLEGKGNNLRAKVLSLKLSPDVEKLCDACRLVGNDAVHEGVLFVDDTDTYEVARTLSMFINWITERTIRSEAMADELLAMAGKKD